MAVGIGHRETIRWKISTHLRQDVKVCVQQLAESIFFGPAILL